MARVLYGVMTATNGHISRALAIVRRLPEHQFFFFGGERLREAIGDAYPMMTVPVLDTIRRRNRIRVTATCFQGIGNLARTPRVCRQIRDIIEQWQPHAAITDREFYLPLAARAAGLCCLSIDHQHIVSACHYPVPASQWVHRALFLASLRALYEFADRNMVVSFFHPPLRPGGTNELLPPVLRSEVADVSAGTGKHVLVYQTTPTFTPLIDAVRQLARPVIVYGFRDSQAVDGNLTFKPFDRRTILEDLAHCAYAVVNGGHNLLCEAFYFHKPVFCFPVAGDFEQFLNAWHVRDLGFGDFSMSAAPSPDLFRRFELRLEDYRANISRRFTDGTPVAIERVRQWIQRCVAEPDSAPTGGL
ncbi:MAG: hypothetical protein HZA88_08440 [Verrucomicrobia bacterium]|nr:hypothetical protein [Verrucomicrobiota bacterium]